MENIAAKKQTTPKLVASSGIDAEKTNILTAVASTVIYLYMFLPFVSWFAFLIPADVLPFQPLYNMYTAPVEANARDAILFDLLLLLSFCVPHSIFARTSVKKSMDLPASMERSFFVLQAAVFMHIKIVYWKNFEGPAIWDVTADSRLTFAILALYAFGAAFLLSATFALDHFHLFGLSQGHGVDLNKKLGLAAAENPEGFVVRWHYKLVAHPIMMGMFLVNWATPKMTAPHLLYSVVTSTWVHLAVSRLEEPTLEDQFGEKYTAYLSSVPRYLPFSLPSSPRFSEKRNNNKISKCPFSSLVTSSNTTKVTLSVNPLLKVDNNTASDAKIVSKAGKAT